MSQKAKQILQKADVDKLSSLPHVLLQLLEICHNERLSFSNLTNILKQDPALFAQFYSICSKYIKPDTKLSTEKPSIELMLEQLGVNTIKSIAVTATVHQFFSRTSDERTDFLKQHWHHSLCCANVAESIAKATQYKQPDDAYTAGLLHDIGQLVLETSYPEKYTSTFAQLSEDDHFHTLELEAFDTTHQQIGAELLKEHGVNRFICDAVLYHHEKVEHILDAHPLVKITFLANLISSRYLNTRVLNTEDKKIFEAAKMLLGLDKAILLEILENTQERVKNKAQTLEIQVAFNGIDKETTKQYHASDEFKQVLLAEQVRNIALLDGIHQHLSRSVGHHSLLHIISQNICLLFGINHCTLFLYDSKDNRVKATAANDKSQSLDDLTIPLVADRSLVTDALINKEFTQSFEEDTNNLSIIDRQLIGLSQEEGIVCLPMFANNAIIGSLVLGSSFTQYENLLKQKALLMRFINEIAHTISANNISKDDSVNTPKRNDPLQQKIHEVLHEVKNPLSIMNNYLGILSYKLDSDKPAQEDVQTIKSEIERINEILNRLTEEESTPNETSPVNINAIISDLTNIFQTSLFADKDIKISLNLDEDVQPLQSNANAFKQVYTNLIKNAVEALPENGMIIVYTQDNVNLDGQQHIEISVTDNGPGIDANILPHLFSPIETNKGDDHAGLGLTIVKNLVSELQGSISCKSSDDGTSFHILLPRK